MIVLYDAVFFVDEATGQAILRERDVWSSSPVLAALHVLNMRGTLYQMVSMTPAPGNANLLTVACRQLSGDEILAVKENAVSYDSIISRVGAGSLMPEQVMGGKPSRATPADKRLKTNRDKPPRNMPMPMRTPASGGKK